MAGLFQRLGLFRGSASASKAVGRGRDYPVDDSDDDVDDEYVPFIASTTKDANASGTPFSAAAASQRSRYGDGQRHLEYLSYDGRSVTIPETGVATTIKHSKLFIGCNVLVTALTLMLVAVALYADARHRTSRWYRGAEYLVLFLLSLDLWVEVRIYLIAQSVKCCESIVHHVCRCVAGRPTNKCVTPPVLPYSTALLLLDVQVSFQGCRRFHCTEAGGGDPSLSATAVGTRKPRCFSCYRCLGCCLSWTQLLLFVCSMMLFYVVNFHSK